MIKKFIYRKSVTVALIAMGLCGKGLNAATNAPRFDPVQTFRNIRNIIINSDTGTVKMVPSSDGVTRVYKSGANADTAQVEQTGNTLSITNNRSFWSFGFARTANFTVEVGNETTPEASISLGEGNVDIDADVKNLKIKAGSVNLCAKNLAGVANISAGSGVLTLVHSVLKPITYTINAGDAKVTAHLSEAYRAVSNKIDGADVDLKESDFPVVRQGAAFNLHGSVGSAEISIHKID
jgi:hypothetical protein